MKYFRLFCLLLGVECEEKRNFVIIVTDAFDGRIVENYNYKSIVDLPNIEKLQKSGTTFSKTYCDSPLCVPSRAALLSGRKNNKIEAWNNFKGLDPSFRNWTSDFIENGWNVGIYGKMDDLSGESYLY